MRTDVTAPKVRMSSLMPRQIITPLLFVAALIYWPCMVSAQLAGAESISLMQADGPVPGGPRHDGLDRQQSKRAGNL